MNLRGWEKIVGVAVLILPLIGCVNGTDFEAGYAAAKRGNYATAYRLWKPLAEQGHSGAQFNLGLMHYKGQGVPQDHAEAARWHRKAGEQGLAPAQFILGMMYNKGLGVPQDHAEEARWYRKAGEQGHASAQFNLGMMHYKGQGVPQDHTEAALWWRKAAEQGNANAQINLGIMYKDGQGVAQDFAEALNWFEKGTEQGSVFCANCVAWLLATCPDEEVRDGERAVVIAKEVVAKDPSVHNLDTLAAAYAAAGRFNMAVSTQEQAISEIRSESSNDELYREFLERLRAYQSGKPWLKP